MKNKVYIDKRKHLISEKLECDLYFEGDLDKVISDLEEIKEKYSKDYLSLAIDVEYCGEYTEYHLYGTRKENSKEKRSRLDKEKKKREASKKRKENKKEKIIKEAKQLGLKVVDE